jgi:membrane protein YqaA with SNARE-associated domain
METEFYIRMRRHMESNVSKWISFGWGLAEATLFFIVPDVYIGWVALIHWRKGIGAVCYAVAGAVLGGVMMYVFGYSGGESAAAILTSVPLIHAGLVQMAIHQLQTTGLPAIMAGPWLGIPYKIYAMEAGVLALPLFPFLALTIPARGIRFLFVAAIAAGFRLLFPRLVVAHTRAVVCMYGTLWIFFYIGYYFLMERP